jgi:hypothetical protein
MPWPHPSIRHPIFTKQDYTAALGSRGSALTSAMYPHSNSQHRTFIAVLHIAATDGH